MSGFSCTTIFLLSTLAADVAPPPLRVVSVQATPEWDSLFAGRTGWIGADGVFSQPLRDDRVLWLFGDTLYGRVDGRRRVDAVMVNNSIAITGRSPETAGSFPVFRTAANAHRSSLVPPNGPGWFWPLSVSLVEDRLAIFLTRVDKTNEPGVFGFQLIGQSLALVTNPESPPTEWTIDWVALPNTLFTSERQRSWGAALLPIGDWLYIYGVDERIPADPAQRQIDRKEMLLARCAPSSLARVETWQYFSETGWSDDPAAAKPLLRGLASEYSVTRLPDSKAILLVHTDCGLSPKILARTATAPEGPWSDPTLLFTKPEVVADKGLFGYNGKAHAWACRALGPGRGTLLVNYAVNAWEFRRLFDDETVYRPRFVTIEYEHPEAAR